MEEEERGNGLLWAGLIVSLLAAIAFAVLWYLRGGEIDRLRTESESIRQAATATETRLDGEITTLQADGAAKDRRITELQNSLQADVRRAEDAGRTAERRLQTELDTARSRLTDVDAEIARQVEEATAASRAEAAALRENLRAAEDALSNLTGEQTRIREEYESASSVLEATRQQTATSERELTDLRDLAARLEKQAAENAAALAGVERERAEAEQGRADAERELTRVREELERTRGRAGEAGETEEIAEPQANAGAGEAAVTAAAAAEVEAGRARERNLNQKVQELTARLAEREAEFVARMETARDAALARVEALEKEYAARLAAAEEKLAAAERKLTGAAAPAGTAAMTAPAAAPAGGPVFAAGRIFGRMPDGSTFLVSGGAEQRMRPGLKFDVYRPEGGANRYIGAVRVIRVLDGYSLAVSAGGGETVRLCPATGRVVMDSAVTESPFAPGRELLNVTAEDYVFDAPAVGDRLDNPFFAASRPIRFGLDGDLPGNECVLAAVAALGGMPLPGDAAERDYLLVSAAGDAAKRISLEHLAAYLDPRPDFSCE